MSNINVCLLSDKIVSLNYFNETRWRYLPPGYGVNLPQLWPSRFGLLNNNDRMNAQEEYIPQRVLEPG